jgi:hypothetical protein
MVGRKATSFSQENDKFLIEHYLNFLKDQSLSKSDIFREFKEIFKITLSNDTLNKRCLYLYEEYQKQQGKIKRIYLITKVTLIFYNFSS